MTPSTASGPAASLAGGTAAPAGDPAGNAIDRETAETYARWFQALSDPTRIQILSYLSRQHAPVAVGTIAEDMGLGQSTVSHHLKTLFDVGFVTRARDRTSRLYAVNHNCVVQFPTAADIVMGRPPRAVNQNRPAQIDSTTRTTTR
jgi:DNA-binding transcriptional ArsR family regulator